MFYQQDNADPFVWLSMLPKQPDPMAFLKEVKETMQLSQIVRQAQTELNQWKQAKAEAKAESEAADCRRLTAIIINHAQSQGVSKNSLPHLMSKSYTQLCQYIQDEWSELSAYI